MISVIVPVYNSGDSIERCINSISNQSYKDVEIIIIDDGSTDNSRELIQVLQKNDNRINYYRQENAGVSSARNYGLDVCKGDYVCFVDSDDMIDEQYLELLLNKKTATNADIVLCGYREINSGSYHDWLLSEQEQKQLSGSLIDDMYPLRFFINSPWMKLFTHELIIRSCLRFREDLVTAEDQYFNYHYYELCKTAAFVNYPGYIYIRNTESLSRANTSRCFENEIENLKYKISFINKHNIKNGDLIIAESICYVARRYFILKDDKNTIEHCYKRLEKMNLLNKPLQLEIWQNNIIYNLLRREHYLILYSYLWLRAYVLHRSF